MVHVFDNLAISSSRSRSPLALPLSLYVHIFIYTIRIGEQAHGSGNASSRMRQHTFPALVELELSVACEYAFLARNMLLFASHMRRLECANTPSYL